MPSGQKHSSLTLSAATPLVYLIFMLHLESNASILATQWKLWQGLWSTLSTLALGINLLAWHESLSPSVKLNVNPRNAETPLVMSALLKQANST